MAVQRQHQQRDRALRAGRRVGGRVDRVDRVLERRVVELHHVHALRCLAGLEPARQVDVDDVEAAAAEAEVDRGGIDNDLVTHLA